MFLLGAGAAFPSIELSDDVLSSLESLVTESLVSIVTRCGVRSRRVSLPLDFLKHSKVFDFLDNKRSAVISPTMLGVEASRQALARAGISIEQVGLVVADTATPYQTCPSEAQRIAGAFGVKVPAYDIVGGAGSLGLFLTLLSSWRADRVPDYVLCVSTNTPSQQVDFARDGVSGRLFGDAAAAVVVSRNHQGLLSVVESNQRVSGAHVAPIVVGRTLSIDGRSLLSEEEVSRLVSEELSAVEATSAGFLKEGIFIGPQLYAAQFASVASAHGVTRDRVVSLTESHGYSLGSSAGVALESLWERIASGQRVAVLHFGDGMVGRTLLRAR